MSKNEIIVDGIEYPIIGEIKGCTAGPHWVMVETGSTEMNNRLVRGAVLEVGDDEWEWDEEFPEEEESKLETIKVFGVEYQIMEDVSNKNGCRIVEVEKGQDEEGRMMVQEAVQQVVGASWAWHGPVRYEQKEEKEPSIKRTISVWEPGSMVKLVDELEGRIRAVQIRMDGSVVYEIAWWKDHNRHTAWMNEGEFKVVESGEKCQIGFVKEE